MFWITGESWSSPRRYSESSPPSVSPVGGDHLSGAWVEPGAARSVAAAGCQHVTPLSSLIGQQLSAPAPHWSTASPQSLPFSERPVLAAAWLH